MENTSSFEEMVTVDEAVALINSNTFDKPTTDIRYLALRLDWCDTGRNFNIPKVRIATKEEYVQLMKRFPGRKPSELIKIGSVFVPMRTRYEVELLKQTIKDNYAKVSGREFTETRIRGITTVNDQESGMGTTPRRTKKTVAREGAIIGDGAMSTTNSADGAGV